MGVREDVVTWGPKWVTVRTPTCWGMSAEELGKVVGVKRAAVNKWETGETKISSATPSAQQVLRVSPSYLMGVTIPNVGVLKAAASQFWIDGAGNRFSDGEESLHRGRWDIRVDCLRVRGDSMIDARICDGDLVSSGNSHCRRIPVVLIDEVT